MDLERHLDPNQLEKYAFYWLLGLLVLSALALLVGVNPPQAEFYRPQFWQLQELFWLTSGIAAVYLVYRWHQNGRHIFPGAEESNVPKDKLAFWLMILVGLNVGLTSVIGHNIFLSLFWDRFVHGLVTIACLVSANHLYFRFAQTKSLFKVTSDSTHKEA